MEDTDTTFAELEQHFGKHVASIVAEATDDKKLSKVQRKKAQIEHAPHISNEGKIVKIADKISNLRDLLIQSPWYAQLF